MLISDYSARTSEVQGEKIFLDLSDIDLFGFHKEVDDRTINSMLDEIRKGREFRSVYVVRGKDREYYLTCIIDSERGGFDGGHHRAYAHYKAGLPLKCEIVDSSLKAVHAKISIRDIVIRS